MKRLILQIIFLMWSFSISLCYAGGGLTHMYIAENVIAKLPDPELRNILLTNLDAYLVGSYYPDSGYVKGTHYGEDSHWDLFIYTFADYIKEKYSSPTLQNPKLIAFLFGCAAHRVSDEIMHVTFYNVMKDKDFNGNYDLAHHYADFGIDVLIDVEKKSSLILPQTWWLPVKDLLEVYHRMQKDNYTAQEIIWGNSVIDVASHADRIISPLAYPFMKWKMPWTASNYFNWPEGGIQMDEDQVVNYQMELWQRLKTHMSPHKINMAKQNKFLSTDNNLAVITFAESLLADDIISVKAFNNNDGSVELQSPIVNQVEKLNTQINKFLWDLNMNRG